jgi:hypothetical protein
MQTLCTHAASMATATVEPRCTILINTDLATAGQQDEIIRDLEHHPHVSMKIRAIKQAITLLLAGEVMPRCSIVAAQIGIAQQNALISVCSCSLQGNKIFADEALTYGALLCLVT